MATYDYRVGSSNVGMAYGAVHECFVQERYLDFAQIAAARSAAGLAAIASTDILQVVGIPADTFVIAVTAKVVKAQGGTFTFSLGDSGSATQYQTNTNGNSVASSVSAATAWKVYNTADNLIMTINQSSINLAQILIQAVMARVSQTTGPLYGGLQN